MEADETRSDEASGELDRATRLAERRGSRRRYAVVTSVVVVLVIAAAAGAYAAVTHAQKASGADRASDPPQPAPSTVTRKSTTTTVPPTTTTTIPPVIQPKDEALPDPGSGIGYGSRGPDVLIYEARMKQLHFDPGPVDGVFDQDTQYAVTTVQKYFGLPRTGVINAGVDLVLTHFRYSPALPTSEPDRVEIDLDRQVLTLFSNWQPVLLTTTSTGSGEHFCGGVDGCQYAITPTGHFHFYDLVRGWQKGKLGTMWNPYYFNGSIAVHGLDSVPAYPASHGCARIPIHIADYFYTLVHNGESVYVVGTAMKPGNGYIGPVPTPPSTAAPTTTSTPPTTAAAPTTVKPLPGTTVKTTGSTTKPTTPTTPPKKKP
ncbi:MAG TPA: L,D-transpeptidase family protein [Acidimicrobiia bacterium]|nr:L,D-transpeptidase family protein [Acidimicrobiia bacterium]